MHIVTNEEEWAWCVPKTKKMVWYVLGIGKQNI